MHLIKILVSQVVVGLRAEELIGYGKAVTNVSIRVYYRCVDAQVKGLTSSISFLYSSFR